MSCDPVVPPEELTNGPRLPPGGTTLVAEPDALTTRTTRCETDAVGALRRGLAEYLRTATFDTGTVRVQFVEVFEAWADPSDEARYPSAAVLVDGDADFDASSFTPVLRDDDQLPDGRWLVKRSEVVVPISIVAHCSSNEERIAVAMLLEDALNPVDWMHGFRLDLPHYYGQRGEYEATSADFTDQASDARHGLRPLVVKLEARVSQVTARQLPLFAPRLDVTLDE